MKRLSRITSLALSALMVMLSVITAYAVNTIGTAETATVSNVERMSMVEAPYPFEFVVASTEENEATISFVPGFSFGYTFYLGVKGEKTEILKINRTQYIVEADVEYAFVYTYTVGDEMTVYNGTLIVKTNEDDEITVTPTNVVKNITYAGDITSEMINLNSLADARATGTRAETESNNTYSTANRTYDDYDNYGALTTNTDVDWWVVSFLNSGTVNFWLGNIPANCDYELEVYASNGTTLLMTSDNSGNEAELITCPVEAGVNYYVKIYSYSGYSTSQYLFRVKNYATDGIQANKVYTIKNASNNKYLTVYQARNFNVAVYTTATGTSDYNNNGSRMRLNYDSSGSYYSIAPICSYNGGYRVVNANALSAGSQVYLTTSNTTSTARFVFELQSDGSYIICCKNNSNLVLDINSSGNVIVNTRSSSSSQKWILALDTQYNNKEILYSSYNWAWPLTVDYGLTSSYGHRMIEGEYEPHYGIDISAYKKTVYCPTQSTYIVSGNDETWGCGFYLIIETNNEVYNNESLNIKILLQHLDNDPEITHSDIASYGTILSKGTAIATTGDSGTPGKYHLHYTVINDGSNVFVNGNYITRTYNNTENPLLFYSNENFIYHN